MKLVVATPLYPPEAGGPATFAKVLEEELPKRGWEVETVKFGDVKHLPKIVRHIAYAHRVRRAARRAHAVLALDPVSTGLPALWAARRAGKKFFVRVAGDYAWEQGVQRSAVKETLDEFVTRKNYSFLVWFLRKVQTHVAHSAKRVIVPSVYLKRIVGAWGVPKEKICVAYNAAPEVDKTMFPRPRPEPYLVSIGRLVSWKGMDGVIRAVAGLSVPHTLVIVGDGPERKKLEVLTGNLGVTERVVFTGNLSHEETLRYLAHAQTFVLDTHYEGMSHLLLEALALGTPIATTAAGGNPEIIRDGETGLVFPYEDVEAIRVCIGKLRPEAELWKTCTANGRALVNGFTREKMIQSVVDALA